MHEVPGRGMAPGELEEKDGTMKGGSGQDSWEQTPEEEEGGSPVGTWFSPERLSNLPRPQGG